ncbi:MAG: hypothetical protein KGH65_03560 [Candidatus Micrarchaeota archaeon]|nr:hypothetical protein [Candidatus Micrarchaeota archaeon]
MPRKRPAAADAKGAQKPKPIPLWPFAILLVALIAFYSLQNNILIGVAAFILFIVIIVLILKEVKDEVQEKGSKQSFKEIAMVIGVVVVLWVALILVLQTTSPLNAVSSCSMLPALQRGDGIILHGISNFTAFTQSNNVPVVNLSVVQFASLQNNMANEFVSYYAYLNGNKSKITSVLPPGDNFTYSIALYNNECLAKYQQISRPQFIHFCYVGQNPQSNLIKFNYSIGKLLVQGLTYRAIYTSAITIANTTIVENYGNPIIVYQTTAQDSFSGPIIHRLVAEIAVNGTYYTLTKGDNNQALDIEFDNYPASQGDVIGYVYARIPLIGYARLLISGQFAQPPGCDQVITPAPSQ